MLGVSVWAQSRDRNQYKEFINYKFTKLKKKKGNTRYKETNSVQYHRLRKGTPGRMNLEGV